MADVIGRLQALHACGLPRCLPDRRPGADRVRHRDRAARRVQRLRVLRVSLPVRCHRPPRGRRARLEVHDVLRPAARRARARLLDGVPHRLDSVRPAGRAARGRRGPAGGSARGGPRRGPAVRRGPGRRRRRDRRLLPAARRAGGVRPAAGPGGADQGPGVSLALGRRSRRRTGRGRRRRVRREPMAEESSHDRAAAGPASRLSVLLRTADPEGAAVEGAAPAAVPVPRRAVRGGRGHGSGSGGGRQCGPGQGLAERLPVPRSGAPPSSSRSSAAPSGSCICCGSPSRPRR